MFRNLKLAARIGLGFGALALLALALGALGYFATSTAGEAVRELALDDLPSVRSLLEIESGLNGLRAAQTALVIPGLSAEERERCYEQVTAARTAYGTNIEEYERLPRSSEEDQNWQRFQTALAKWRTANDKFFELSKALDQTHILDPENLRALVHLFRGDHAKLERNVMHLIFEGEEIRGGDDHTACNFGKWVATFATANPEFRSAVEAAIVPHRKMHEAVKRIKELAAAGDRDGAKAADDEGFEPAIGEMNAHLDTLLAIATRANDLYAQMHDQADSACKAAADEVAALLHELAQSTNAEAAEAATRHSSQSAALRSTALIATGVALALAALLGYFITRSITRPVHRIVAQLSEGSGHVAQASAQINASATQLASASTEQAASLEETTSALEEMSAMTRANADNAGRANELVTSARDQANQSNAEMARLNGAMTAINDSSGQISKIIKVIEEIAFQTNLLALNAAVEAARAGEHGKGFAVVAEEVRTLAQRAADAARETTTLIEASVTRAREGAQVAGGFGQTISGIVDCVSKAADLVRAIHQASNEQASGVKQINTAVTQMDSVTQSIAASAEESAAAVEELNAQANTVASTAGELARLVGARLKNAAHDADLEPHGART